MVSTDKNQKIFFAADFSFYIRLGIGLLGVLFLAVTISRLVYPFDNGFLEAFNWLAAGQLLEGKNPYASAMTPPYSMAPYGIVYYALLAIGVKFFGLQLWWGRLLSVIAFAFCVWSGGKITKKLTASGEAVLVTVLISLALFPAQSVIAVVRCTDFIAVAFALGAFQLIIARGEDEKLGFSLILGLALLLSAAFFTKQSFLLPIGIIGLRLTQLRKFREAIWLFLLFFILVNGGVFLLNYTSDGGYIWQHYTNAQRLPYSFADAFELLFVMLTTPAFLFFLIFSGIWFFKKYSGGEANLKRLTKTLRAPETLVLIYFLSSLGWDFLTAGRIGANVNYYMENSFAAAILGGIIYAAFKRTESFKLAAAMIIALSLGGAFQLARAIRGEYFRWQSLAYYREIFETAAKFTPPGSKCVSVYPELVAWNGCQFQFGDYEEYDRGWAPDLSEILDREMNRESYAVVIWNNDKLESRFPPYKLVPMTRQPPERFFRVYLYVRRAAETP